MADTKRFYWLKLKEDFFRQKEIKKLRRIAGGDTFTIIYLKMLLRSLKDGGRLYYEGIEDNFASEVALDIDEDEDNVKMTVAFLIANGILVQNQTDEYELLTASEMTDSETDSAHRVRKFRAKKANEALLCNGTVTSSNVEIEKEIEKEIEVGEKPKRKRFTPPTVADVQAYADDKQWTAQEFSAERFVDFYASKGWKVGRDTMKDWKAAARGWVSRYRQEHPNTPQEQVKRDLSVEEVMRRNDDCSVPEGFTPIGGW